MNWIKCSERMPDPEKIVLVLWGSEIMIAYVSLSKQKSVIWKEMSYSGGCGCCEEDPKGKVTHWMELPEAPKD